MMFRVGVLASATGLLLLAACIQVAPTPVPTGTPTASAEQRDITLHVVSSWQREGSTVFPPVAATINGRDYLFFGTSANYPPNDKLLNVLDVTDPTSPKEAAHLAPPERYWINRLVLIGTTLYAGVMNDFWIVDVSNPTAPRHLSVFNTGSSPNKAFLVGNYLYTNIWEYTESPLSIQVIDVSDPSNPRVAASVPVARYAGIREASGNRLYCIGLDGFRIMDISSPLEPLQIGFYADPTGIEDTGSDSHAMDGFSDVAVSGDYAFIASGLSGLRVLDISDPSNIREVNKLNPADWVFSISIYGNLALLMGAYEQPFHFEMLALDISAPDNPRTLDTLGMPVFAVDRPVRLGDYIYVYAGGASLMAVGLYAD